MPYVRRPRVSRKRTSARPARPKRAYRKRRTLVPRSVKPEIKVNQVYYPFSTPGNIPATSFTDTYPADDSNLNLVDTMPGQGIDSYQRIGNVIQRIGYQIDLWFQADDFNVDCRFVLFKWLVPTAPDVASWASPLDNATVGAGAGFNPWFPARSTQNYTVLYQKAWRFGQMAPQPGTLPRYHVRKFLKRKELVRATMSTGLPNSMSSSAVGNITSYKGRIYWCVVTNNVAGSQISFAGYCRHYFIDA